MTVNTKLAAEVYTHLSMYPESHDQSSVVEGVGYLPNGNICGTVGCIAGWTCAYAGLLEPVIRMDGKINYVDDGDWFMDAKRELGISERLADALFATGIPEGVALTALGFLATGGGSEEKAIDYLMESDWF